MTDRKEKKDETIDSFEIAPSKSFFIPNKSKPYLIEKFHRNAHLISTLIIVVFCFFLIEILINNFMLIFFDGYVSKEIEVPSYLVSIASSIIGFYIGSRFKFSDE